MCFSLHLEKLEKEAKFVVGESIILYRPPLTGLRIRWNFATFSDRLRDPLAQSFTKKEEEKQNK